MFVNEFALTFIIYSLDRSVPTPAPWPCRPASAAPNGRRLGRVSLRQRRVFCTQNAAPQASRLKGTGAACRPPLPAPTSPALGGLLAGPDGASDGRQAQEPLHRRQMCAFTWAGIQLAGKPQARVEAGSWGRGEGRHRQPPIQPSQGLRLARGCSRGITSRPRGPQPA